MLPDRHLSLDSLDQGARRIEGWPSVSRSHRHDDCQVTDREWPHAMRDGDTLDVEVRGDPIGAGPQCMRSLGVSLVVQPEDGFALVVVTHDANEKPDSTDARCRHRSEEGIDAQRGRRHLSYHHAPSHDRNPTGARDSPEIPSPQVLFVVMSNPPGDGPDDISGHDPFEGSPFGPGSAFEQVFKQLGLPVPQPGEQYDMTAMLKHVQGLFSAMPTQSMTSAGGGVNWSFAKDVARKVVASVGPDPTPSAQQRRETSDAIHLAELWLNEATIFDACATPPAVWSRAEWVEETMPAWQTMVEPIVSTIAREMGSAVSSQMAEDPSMAGMTQMLQPMLQQSASGLFGAQLGQALGRLGTEVVSGTDVGLPLVSKPQVALVLTNVLSYGEGLDLPERDVVLYHALREAARQRLFGSVGWVGPQLVALVLHYAREITVDPEAFEQSIGEMMGSSPDDLARLSDELGRTLFSPAKSQVQLEILGRLETLLALVEGWVDDVVAQATSTYMPAAAALAETVRRRRAAGGPAEQTLAQLVGLELRPRRLRDAANLWAAYRSKHGLEARDGVWRHPDVIPTAADLDDPLGFVDGRDTPASDDLDAELAKLLDAERGDPGSKGHES